jgi:ABC-type uncharacterized transport system permease subunit
VHLTAIILVAAAGLCYVAAALVRWRQMALSDERRSAHLIPLWLGLGLHSVSLVLSLINPGQRDFAYGVLAVWAAVAGLFFVSRYLASPSRTILVLPVGGMALLVAMAELASGEGTSSTDATPWITRVHVAFMALHLAVMLLSGAAGGMYLTAVRQLKSPSPRALRLPSLPLLERLTERSLVVGTALLMGGLATGGAAMQLSRSISLAQPSIVLALITMALLVLILALRSTGHLNRRGVALGAVWSMLIAALGAVSQLVVTHG